MKFQTKKAAVYWPIGLACWLSLLSGCSWLNAMQATEKSPAAPYEYASEISDPQTKALFAFSEFRLLGAQNRWDEAIEALARAVAFDPQSDYLQLVLAKAYLHREQADQAVTILEDLLRRSPDNSEAHQFLGDVLSYQQKFDSAIEHFQAALQLSPSDEMLQMRLAMALAKNERKQEAVAVLEQLVDKAPSASLARLSLARLYHEQGRESEAVAAYRELLELNPGLQQAVIEYGKLLEQRNPDAALELYESAIAFNPRAAVVRQQLAEFYLARRQLNEALQQLQELRQLFPGNMQVIGQIGLVLLELERWSEAESEFRLLLASGAHQDRNRYYLAMALQAQGGVDEAIELLRLVDSESVLYGEALLQLAYLYKKSGQDDSAIAVLQRMIDEDFKHADVYYYLAAFLGEREDFTQALEYAHDGVRNNPEDTRLLYQLGILYEKVDNRRAAVEVMETILAIDDSHADALNFLAYHQAEEELDLELALTRARRALAIKPSGYIVDTLGWIYFKMGRYEESREQLEEATRLHPEDKVIWEHLGDLYRAMEIWDAAATAYRRALEIDPALEQVKEKLRTLPAGKGS